MNATLTAVKKAFDAYKFKKNNRVPRLLHIQQPPVRVHLFIKQLNFFSGFMWEFTYDQPIIAHVLDQLFLLQVSTGEVTFHAGDFLDCLLEMEYVIENGDVKKGSEGYRVTEVFKVVSDSQTT